VTLKGVFFGVAKKQNFVFIAISRAKFRCARLRIFG
jgi:hypothetical protein